MGSFVYFFGLVVAVVAVLAVGPMVHQAVMYDMIMMDSKRMMDFRIARNLLKPVHCLNLSLL